MTTTYELHSPVSRLREDGPQGLGDAELISCLLQGKQTLALASTLLTETGGIVGFSRTEARLLEEINGIGPANATRLIAAIELGRRLMIMQVPERYQIRNPSDSAQMLIPLLSGEPAECLAVVYLDTRNRVLGHEILYRGTLNTTVVRIVEVFRGAVTRRCAAIIVAHNHPSGDPAPSSEDVSLTRRLVSAGKLLEVDVLDHVIVGGNRYTSLRERGLGFEEA